MVAENEARINGRRITLSKSAFEHLGSPSSVGIVLNEYNCIIVPWAGSIRTGTQSSSPVCRYLNRKILKHGAFIVLFTKTFGHPTLTILNCRKQKDLNRYGTVGRTKTCRSYGDGSGI